MELEDSALVSLRDLFCHPHLPRTHDHGRFPREIRGKSSVIKEASPPRGRCWLAAGWSAGDPNASATGGIRAWRAPPATRSVRPRQRWRLTGRRPGTSAVGAVARVAVAELVLAARATGARRVAPDLGELVARRFGVPLDLAAAVRARRAVGEPGGPLRAAEPWRDDPRLAAFAGLSAAGLAAGLGAAALAAGLATGLGIGFRTAATARLGAAAARSVPAPLGQSAGPAGPRSGRVGPRCPRLPRRSGSAGTRAGG